MVVSLNIPEKRESTCAWRLQVEHVLLAVDHAEISPEHVTPNEAADRIIEEARFVQRADGDGKILQDETPNPDCGGIRDAALRVLIVEAPCLQAPATAFQ